MGTITLEGNVGLSPEALWDEMKNFGDVAAFLDVVTSSDLVDGDAAKRVCVLADGTVLDESLVAHDDAGRTLTYTITSGLPLATHQATMSVTDAGDGRSMFHWTTDATAADGAPDGFLTMFEGMLAGEVTKLEQRWP